MILQRTLAALAAAGIFGASAGCLWAYADELPVEGEQLPDTVYATAGNENSADGAVIYSVDSSNYTEGYKVDLKAEKDNLLSVDKITIQGESVQDGTASPDNPVSVFGLGEQRADGYYISLNYVDDLGNSGTVEVGPLDSQLMGFDGYSDSITLSSELVVVNRRIKYEECPFVFLFRHYINGAWLYAIGISEISLSSNINYSLDYVRSPLFNPLFFATGTKGDMWTSAKLYSIKFSHSDRSQIVVGLPENFETFQDAQKAYGNIPVYYVLNDVKTETLPSDYIRGTLPSNVQSLQISCSGDVSADVSNRPSAIPSVTSEDGLPAVFSATGKYVDFVTSNPVTAVCFSSTLVPIGIAVLRCLRGVV